VRFFAGGVATGFTEAATPFAGDRFSSSDESVSESSLDAGLTMEAAAGFEDGGVGLELNDFAVVEPLEVLPTRLEDELSSDESESESSLRLTGWALGTMTGLSFEGFGSSTRSDEDEFE
jgi:hypothetical protein